MVTSTPTHCLSSICYTIIIPLLFLLMQGYHSSDRKKIHNFSSTFPDEIASNMSNKCTFINIVREHHV